VEVWAKSTFILPLFDYGEATINGATLAYMVMPYRQEGSLTNWLRQRGSTQLLPTGVIAQLSMKPQMRSRMLMTIRSCIGILNRLTFLSVATKIIRHVLICNLQILASPNSVMWEQPTESEQLLKQSAV
jgi:hypothetical protein